MAQKMYWDVKEKNDCNILPSKRRPYNLHWFNATQSTHNKMQNDP